MTYNWNAQADGDDLLKVIVKLSLCLTNHHAMKTYWGSGGGQRHAPVALPPEKAPPVPIG
jgi:hypothetical protein